jgi:hypothetical protein
MVRFSRILAATIVALSVVSLAVSGVAFAAAGNSGNTKLCQLGGWASPNLQDGSGNLLTFANQGGCVSFGAQGGQLFNPSLAGNPQHVVEGQESFYVASGFHPLSLGTLTLQIIGGAGGSVTLPAKTTATGGLPAGVGTLFLPGACAAGVAGADVTLVDGQGVHASTTIALDCP